MKNVIPALILLTACSHSMKDTEMNKLSNFSDPQCTVTDEDFRLPLMSRTTRGLKQVVGTTSSYAVSTLGYATDAALIGGGILTMAWLCGELDSACRTDLLVDSFMLSDDLDIFTEGVGHHVYAGTGHWRCPYVDHISQALRRSAECNMRKGKIEQAFVQLDPLDANETLKRCVSHVEKGEIQAQLIRYNGLVGQN